MSTIPATPNIDLREVAAQTWGHPLASSALASLWRCPCCAAKTRSLMLVSASQFRCLGRCHTLGGLTELEQLIARQDRIAPPTGASGQEQSVGQLDAEGQMQ